jgi:hypothetical protein
MTPPNEPRTQALDLKTKAIQKIIEKGFDGLLIAALCYFIWHNSAQVAPLIEKNTEAIGKNSAIIERASKVMERNLFGVN